MNYGMTFGSSPSCCGQEYSDNYAEGFGCSTSECCHGDNQGYSEGWSTNTGYPMGGYSEGWSDHTITHYPDAQGLTYGTMCSYCQECMYAEDSASRQDRHEQKNRDAFGQQVPLANINQLIQRVIINEPYTIILWKDGSKTRVKCNDEDEFDADKGVAFAILKRICGNDNTFHKIFTEFVDPILGI